MRWRCSGGPDDTGGPGIGDDVDDAVDAGRAGDAVEAGCGTGEARWVVFSRERPESNASSDTEGPLVRSTLLITLLGERWTKRYRLGITRTESTVARSGDGKMRLSCN